jgi:hypothetical protein
VDFYATNAAKIPVVRRAFGVSAQSATNSQESKRFALGAGLMGGMNSTFTMAARGSLSFDYNINETAAVGAKAGFAYFLKDTFALEPEAVIRWYFYRFPRASLFAQWDMGIRLIFNKSGGDSSFMAGASLGARFFLGTFYVEPFLRGGFPWEWGLGVMGGCRF